MRKILLFIFIPIHLFSQDSSSNKKALTKLETLSNQQGTIIKKEFMDLGNFAGMNVELLTITDQVKGNSKTGIKFSNSERIGYSSREYSSFLDGDEINGLLKFLDFIQTLSDPVTVYTEFNYQSRGDFKVFAYRKPGAKLWTEGAYADKSYSGSYLELKQKEVASLTQALLSVKSKLNE